MSIRIQIVAGKGLISKAIMFGTRGWASHAELVDTERHETLGERASGGLKVRPLEPRQYKKVEQFVLNCEDSPRRLQLMWDWLHERQGMPYNYLGIVGISADLTLTEPKAMDCSHAIFAASWQGAGFPLLSTRPSNLPWRVTPRDLLLSRNLVWVPTA